LAVFMKTRIGLKMIAGMMSNNGAAGDHGHEVCG
jgi:hypothetical protein